MGVFSILGNTEINVKCWYYYLMLLTCYYKRESFAHIHSPDYQIKHVMRGDNIKQML